MSIIHLTITISSNKIPGGTKISHSIFMRRALALASLGLRKTSPNPMVGCVIVKEGSIIGEGWHHQFGGPHAEIEALNDAISHGHDVRGSSVYVTLEPCSHYGKTPPCANRLVSEGVHEVIIAMTDPNPKVNGRGISILREAGIKVTSAGPEFESEAKNLNRGFVFVQRYSRPFVHLKAAVSLDGRMCLSNGSSKWLTGILSRTKAHEIRSENDAVLVGAGTVLSDNPELTVRHVSGINPLRVVLDSRLTTPPDSKIIGHDGKCLILTGYHAGYDREESLRNSGAEIQRLSTTPNGRIDLHEALRHLAERGVLTVMAEGGPEVLGGLLREGLGDYMSVFISPRVLGEGRGININSGFETVSEAPVLRDIKTSRLGEDTLIEGRLTCSPDL